jgi:short-subunit dehydrogenase
MTLKDQSWVLVTGASSGLGEEFARQYAAQGRPLVLVARRIEKLRALATELRERYRVDVIVEQVDLSVITAVVDLHTRLRERGVTIDVLINNAGHGFQGPFLDEPLDRTLAMLNLDVLGFAEALHREFKHDGIVVTALSPGMSDTGFAAAANMTMTPMLKLLTMRPAPVVRAGIDALQAGHASVVPGWRNKASMFVIRAARRLNEAVMSRVMVGGPHRGQAYASLGVARR